MAAPIPDKDQDPADPPRKWHSKLFARFRRTEDLPTLPEPVESNVPDDEQQEKSASLAVVQSARDALAGALIGAVRSVSNAHDRDEITRWLSSAAEILSEDTATTTKAAKLYKAVNSRRVAGIAVNTVKTALNSYKGSSLPLAIKVALPVTLAGLPFLGLHGAGIVAFGGGVGVPVVLLLFLGSAGVASVVEAIWKDNGSRDPLLKLLNAIYLAERTRRFNKETAEAMRAEASVPKRDEGIPPEESAILEYLLAMDPFVFERHVMSFFEDMGHPVGNTGKTNDSGIDGYVLHPDGLIVVQCKRYTPPNSVGSPEVQQFMGVIMQKQASRAYFVTTASFTAGAKRAAATCDKMTLIDGEELVRWHIGGKRTA